MEALYNCKRKTFSTNPTAILGRENIDALHVRVSTQNTITFTSQHELMSGIDTKRDKFKPFYFVYCCDLLSPWNVFLVTKKTIPITVLEWDPNGQYLLIGDNNGRLEYWGKRNHLLSDWYMLHYANFPGETIIQAEFFYNGRTTNILMDNKRDNYQYMEKFQNLKYKPSVRKFGGTAEHGCLVVTSTGLLGAFIIPYDNGGVVVPQTYKPRELTPVTQTLALVRNYITIAAIAYAKIPSRSGYFRVAVTNTENKSNAMVHCFSVEIALINNKLNINSKYLSAFFGSDHNDHRKITNLKWIISNDCDSLIVTEASLTSCITNLWTLSHKAVPIHKFLQTAAKNDVFKHYSWSKQCQYESASHVLSITSTKNTFDTTFIYLLMKDNSIHILRRDLKLVTTTNCLSDYMKMESLSKMPKVDKQLACIDLTFMSHVLVTIDNTGEIATFKAPQFYADQCSNQMQVVNYKTTLLEYCLVTGYDATDILLSMKLNFVESLIEKLSDNFSRQSSSTQQFYYVNFLTMKTNLARLLMNGQTRVNDLTSLIMLHSILTAFKSLLRPAEVTNYEKGPSESLALVLSEPTPDIDKVLMNLDAKDFTFEASLLPSLQQLIQWVSDLALNILSRLPQDAFKSGSLNKSTDYDICKDIVALNSIRELLVMIRYWGLLEKNCLPVFIKSAENIDILWTLFRLLTKLSFNPSEPDEILLDECCSLPTQVVIPPSVVGTTNSAYLAYHQHPQHFCYNIEPDFLKNSRQMQHHQSENNNNNDIYMDCISHYVMGKNPYATKCCSRCGTSTYMKSHGKTVAMNAWELRWSSGCLCGGNWILLKN